MFSRFKTAGDRWTELLWQILHFARASCCKNQNGAATMHNKARASVE